MHAAKHDRPALLRLMLLASVGRAPVVQLMLIHQQSRRSLLGDRVMAAMRETGVQTALVRMAKERI